MRPEAVCDCPGTVVHTVPCPPWPPMTRLHVPGRYFVCLHCVGLEQSATVRQETTWADGTIREVTYHRLDDGTLTAVLSELLGDLEKPNRPKTVINAAREALQPPPVQLELFEV